MNAQKRYDTRNTLQIMLKHPEIMFQVIETMDQQQGMLSEQAYMTIVSVYKRNLDDDNEIVLALQLENLIFAGIVHDKIVQTDKTFILFNEAVVSLFRLCRLSLVKPLTKQSLKTSMSPFWQIYDDLLANRLSLVTTDIEYEDWTQDFTQRLGAIYGQVNANVKKLERIGSDFVVKVGEEARDFAVMQAQYDVAKSIYIREIEPLAVFLDKQTQYTSGKGIYGVCELVGKKVQLAQSNGDNVQVYTQILDYQIKFLSLIPKITQIKRHISLYLQKTKADIDRHNAIEAAYAKLLNAVSVTTEHKQNLLYTPLVSLVNLGPYHYLAKRFIPQILRLPHSPSALANALSEVQALDDSPVELSTETFAEELNTDSLKREVRARQIAQWANEQDWPAGEDYVPEIIRRIEQTGFADIHVADVFDIAMIIRQRYPNITEYYTTRTVALAGMCYRYRVRHIIEVEQEQKL